MWNMNLLCKLTIVIPWLPCPFSIAKAVSSIIELVNSVTSDLVNSYNFVMYKFASKCFPIDPVLCSDGWRRTWWQMIHMVPGLPFSYIPQCKYNHHSTACLELFPEMGCFKSAFIEAHQASNMSCEVRSLRSRIQTPSFPDNIKPSCNEVFQEL